MQSPPARPTGITIIAVLAIIGGVFGVIGACLIFSVGVMSAGALASGGLAFAAIVIAILTLARAVAYLAFGYGAWNLQPWAWMVGMIVAAASILISLLSVILGYSNIASEVVSIVVAGVILYYLNTPGVKAAFGRA